MRRWWLRVYGAKLDGFSAAEYVSEHGMPPELEDLLCGLLGKRRTWGRFRDETSEVEHRTDAS